MVDLTTMLINLSQSMAPLQQFLSGFSYLMGCLFVITGLIKLKTFGQNRQAQAQEGLTKALSLLIGGGLFVYLPSTMSVFSNTFFGASNLLSYGQFIDDPFYHAMFTIVETTGLIWCLRGLYLIIHEGHHQDPKHKGKGFTFFIAGILALNIESTLAAFNASFEYFITIMHAIKSNLS